MYLTTCLTQLGPKSLHQKPDLQTTVFQEGSDHMATIASAYFSKYKETPSRFAEQDYQTCLNRASQKHEITVAHAEPYELGSEQAI